MADITGPTEVQVQKPGYSLAHQTLDIDVDFAEQIRGRTEITLYPDSRDLREVKLNARQCHIEGISINGRQAQSWTFNEPCQRLRLHAKGATIYQHHILGAKLGDGSYTEGELLIKLPNDLKIEEVNVTEVQTQTSGTIKVTAAEGEEPTDTTQTLTDTSVAKFTPLKISIDFISSHLRDGVQFVLAKPGNGRWPHAYTRSSVVAGSASSIFPCIDQLGARCTWDLTIRFPKTVADAVQQVSRGVKSSEQTTNGDSQDKSDVLRREMRIVCSGDMTDDTVKKDEPNTRIASFSCSQQLSAQQIGFAIGPFERVNLSALRDAQEEEQLGQNAVELAGYCLPGRNEEMRNTTLVTAYAMDSIVNKYLSCPFSSYSMCFVEDAEMDTAIFAGLTICSSRILYPAQVIDPTQEVTRKLVHAITSQWFGINIVAQTLNDTWAIVGIAHFMADMFMKDLCGNNEYRYRMRRLSDQICESDRDRPSIYELGALLHVDPSEYEFLSLKAPVVLFILDRRIAKVTGTSKLPGVIGKILTKSRIGDLEKNLLSTELFQRTCERFYHAKIDDFMNQWVKGAGCPSFQVSQKWNKKKFVIEMIVTQKQGEPGPERDLEADTFMRESREEFRDVYAAGLQQVFTGPMTIRIHEANGTPYEHIVELKDVKTAFEIPYNTKYARVSKRGKKKKPLAGTETGDIDTDAVIYSLGDILQSDEEVRDWKLVDFMDTDETLANRESPYEWIRADADFEWIAQTRIMMPGYMATSMLQQDRDVVAQYDALQQISHYPPDALISSILVRTMVDERYFHGIRTTAAEILVNEVKITPQNTDRRGLFHLRKAFEELYCITDSNGSILTRPNNFANIKSYFVQTAIINGLSQVRDEQSHTPHEVKVFLLDKLKFNDNSSNSYSDAHYVSTVMRGLTSAIMARAAAKPLDPDAMDIDLAAFDEETAIRRLEAETIGELDRYRRMDEWTSSYQNLYSRTALECQALLRRAGIATNTSTLHFLQYTRPGNYDQLRLAAYSALIGPWLLDDENEKSVLKYILHCLVADSSPFIRSGIAKAFGRALGSRAFGTASTITVGSAVTTTDLGAPREPDPDGLQIEDPSGADTEQSERQKLLARRQTLSGAMTALQEELSKNEDLKNYLWQAMNYQGDIVESDLRVLLDFCQLLYEGKDEMKISLRLPRYWGVQKTGKVCRSLVAVYSSWTFESKTNAALPTDHNTLLSNRQGPQETDAEMATPSPDNHNQTRELAAFCTRVSCSQYLDTRIYCTSGSTDEAPEAQIQNQS